MSGVVRLRLSMHGRCNHRIFHLVAARVSQARDSMPIETLGVYDPRIKAGESHKTVEWSVDRIKFWLREGAQPTASAVKLLTMGGILKPGSKYHKGVLATTGPTEAITPTA